MFNLKKLFEWTSFQKEIRPIKKEVEPSEKTVITGEDTRFVDEYLPSGFYNTTSAFGSYTYAKESSKIKEWINKYRQYELISDVDKGIDIIINEMVIPDTDKNIVSINLNDCDISDSIKKNIEEKFNKILKLLKFKKEGYDVLRRWYVDGRCYYNIVVDKNNLKQGIKELIPVDSMFIILIKEENSVTNLQNYYYYYDDEKKGIQWKVAPDLVAKVTSGIFDRLDCIEVSNLHKAVKPINNLRNIEDSIVIRTLLNSIEKRVFTVQTGMMNKTKSEAYIKGLIDRFRNKLKYNTITGEVQNEKKTQTIVEDYWFAENSEGKGTKVSTLDVGKTLGELTELFYFRNILWDSMNIPQSRRPTAEERKIYSTGREIERDEIEFHKFICGRQTKFSELFTTLLKRELVWTNIMSLNDFEKIEYDIDYIWNTDNLYNEMKETELLNMRLEVLNNVSQYIGDYFTKDDVALNILKFNKSDWDKKQKQLSKDKEERIESEGENTFQNDNFKKETPDENKETDKGKEGEPINEK